MKLRLGQVLQDYNYLWREIEMLWHEIALSAGMSDSAFTILYTILELGEGCLQKDICNLNAVSKQTVHSSVKNLERDGIIEFRNEGGKEKRVYLKSYGKAFTKEKIFPIANMENEVFAEMHEEESQELIRLTRKYLTQFQEKLKNKEII